LRIDINWHLLIIAAMELEKLISEIERYCAATGQAPSTFCLKVVHNPSLYRRLKSGSGCNVKVLDKIRAHIAANPPPVANGPGIRADAVVAKEAAK
jgi:hypothetical protein